MQINENILYLQHIQLVCAIFVLPGLLGAVYGNGVIVLHSAAIYCADMG